MSFTYQLDGGVGTLTLNRPEQRNALDVPTLKKLDDFLTTDACDSALRCLIITGAGKGFCAGADVAEWDRAAAAGTLESYGWTQAAHTLMQKLYTLPKPVIAAINGAAVGGGLDLALCCDLRYAASSAKFLPGYTAMAYSPDGGSSFHLPRVIGLARATEFLMLDHAWPAEKALSAGLINGVFAAEQLLAEVATMASRLAQGPTFAYAQIKTLLAQSLRHTLAEQLALELAAGVACGRSDDGHEALAAAVAKRPAHYRGS